MRISSNSYPVSVGGVARGAAQTIGALTRPAARSAAARDASGMLEASPERALGRRRAATGSDAEGPRPTRLAPTGFVAARVIQMYLANGSDQSSAGLVGVDLRA